MLELFERMANLIGINPTTFTISVLVFAYIIGVISVLMLCSNNISKEIVK